MGDEEKHFYRFKSFRLDIEERQLLHNSSPVPLTPKAFDVLAVLVERSGHLVEKDELLKLVWADTVVEEANVARIVHTLRKVLGEDENGNKFIETVAKRGYRFVAEVSEIHEPTSSKSVNGAQGSSNFIERSINDETHIPPSKPDEVLPQPVVKLKDKARTIPFAGAFVGGVILIRVKLRRMWKLACFALVGVTAAFVFLWLQPARTVPGSNGPVKSIAIVPFKPLAADSRNESLELGMADTLITKLSVIKDIVIRPVSAVRKYNALEQDPIMAGRELEVDAVLDGSIQTVDDRIRVSVRLTRVADGRLLWVDQFDEKMTHIFTIQDSISAKVTSALALRLTNEDKRLLSKSYTISTEAYHHYLKGRLFWNKRTEEALGKAIDYFQRAIDKDPNYALAYSGLADAYAILGNYLNRPDEFYPKSLEAAKKAVEIDDSLAEAHTSLAYVLVLLREWRVAEIEFKRAIELNTNYPTAHQWYSKWLISSGRLDEALAEIKRAQELDPTSLIINVALGGHYYANRMFDEAIDQFRKTLEMDPNFVHIHGNLAPVYFKKGMTEDAIAECQKAVELSGGRLYRASLAYFYAISGRKNEAQGILEELLQQSKRGYIWAGEIALVYAGLGDKERFFRWLEKAYQEHDLTIDALIAEPLYDPLMSDPRFEDLLRRVRLRDSQ